MNSIQIQTKGSDLETITITLDENQVSSIYEQNKELSKKLAEVEKKLATTEQSLKYSQDGRTELQQELNEANVLMTALGIKEQNDSENSYSRQNLKITTRIALYIAANK